MSVAQYKILRRLYIACFSTEDGFSPSGYVIISPDVGFNYYTDGTSVDFSASSTDTSKWTFTCWKDENGKIVSSPVVMDGDKNRLAYFTPILHTVSYYQIVNGTKSLIEAKKVVHGEDSTPPEKPSVTGYTAGDWVGSYTNVTEDREVTCTYTIIQLTITFEGRDYACGDLWFEQSMTVNYGTSYSSITKPTPTSKSGYTFNGWEDTPEPEDAFDASGNVVKDCVITGFYIEQITFEGYIYGVDRDVSNVGTTTRQITLPAGHKWRITIDDIHFCHGHSKSNHGLGGLFTVTGSGVTIANRYITDDNRSTWVKVPSTYNTAIYLNGNIAADTENAFWPKSFSAYDSGYEAYTASSGEVGPDASLGTPGVQFIYETDTVASSTTLNLNQTAKAYKSSSCQNDTSAFSKGAHTQAHYYIETID